jgi:Cof subfamily protein (haloacid dehalogenase superfamily)
MYQEEELYFHPLEKQDIPELLTIIQSLDNSYTVLCGKQSAYIESSEPRFIAEVEKYYEKYLIVDSLQDVQDDILKISICDFSDVEKNANQAFTPDYRDKLQITVSGKMWLDITHKTASKGRAIQYIQDKFNIGYEQTMVFGDYFNDVTLLENAFHSYAMENAHPGIKKYARFTTASNNDHGVTRAIKQVVLHPS